MTTLPDEAPIRYVVLDALRGIAALVVALSHALSFYAENHPMLHGLGRFGVVLFFLVSGFVIPPAFTRNGSQRTFWIRRLCRLFPLYWLTIAAAALIKAVGWLPETAFYPARLASTYAINLTMIPYFFGYPAVLSVFWSLHIELLFYILVAILGLLRLQRYHALVGFTLLALGLSSAFVPGLSLYYPLFLAVIWCGTFIQSTIASHSSLLKAAPFLVSTLALVALGEGPTGFGPYHVGATVAALMVFMVALNRPAWFSWRGLVWLGTVSYSLYLTHLLVLAVIPTLGSPILSIAVWLVTMLAVAAVAERWIERPSIALGRWLTRPDRRTTQSQSEAPMVTSRVAHHL